MKSVTAYIALGSNLGSREYFIGRAIENLDRCEGIAVTARSDIEETVPLGDMQQGAYLDCVIKVDTILSADDLFGRMTAVEDLLGRTRESRWGPRTIDLDLLLYGNEVIETDRLCIPHKQMHLRSFVLRGMCQLDRHQVHPLLNKTMKQLAERLGGGDFFIDNSKPQLISIAGIIGIGKTTLGQGLSRQFGCPLLREAYDTNPYLADAYAGKTEYALDSQLYFLNSRQEQLNINTLAAGSIYVTDYIFEKDRIFAEHTLNQEQFSEYSRKLKDVEGNITDESLVIYLNDEPEVVMERIRKRNRPYEQKIDLSWLKELDNEYIRLLDAWNKCPVIKISTSEFDGRRSEDAASLAGEIKMYIAAG